MEIHRKIQELENNDHALHPFAIASKFTEYGSVTFRVTVKGQRPKANGKRQIPFALCPIRFSVEDTGISIPAD